MISQIGISTTESGKITTSVERKILLIDSGSGNKDTKTFTLSERSDLKITVMVSPTSDVKYVGLYWYLLTLNDELVKQGSLSGESGITEFYAVNVPQGKYYLRIYSANCKWEIKVEKVA
jgi:hypothetical protein